MEEGSHCGWTNVMSESRVQGPCLPSQVASMRVAFPKCSFLKLQLRSYLLDDHDITLDDISYRVGTIAWDQVERLGIRLYE